MATFYLHFNYRKQEDFLCTHWLLYFGMILEHYRAFFTAPVRPSASQRCGFSDLANLTKYESGPWLYLGFLGLKVTKFLVNKIQIIILYFYFKPFLWTSKLHIK
jgi:hypothetical protein